MRNEKLVHIQDEIGLMVKCSIELEKRGYNASNCVIVTVSSDYSASFGMWLRHALSFEGEVCNGFSVEVPYPDESWDDNYTTMLYNSLNNISKFSGKTLILVEAGVIKGGTYTYITNHLKKFYINTKFITVAMFENIHSKYKSDVVGAYYNNDEEDLTFWWEEENNHWM